jgi:hypothetical protein
VSALYKLTVRAHSTVDCDLCMAYVHEEEECVVSENMALRVINNYIA